MDRFPIIDIFKHLVNLNTIAWCFIFKEEEIEKINNQNFYHSKTAVPNRGSAEPWCSARRSQGLRRDVWIIKKHTSSKLKKYLFLFKIKLNECPQVSFLQFKMSALIIKQTSMMKLLVIAKFNEKRSTGVLKVVI